MTLLINSLHFKVSENADTYNKEQQVDLMLWINAVGCSMVLNDGTRIAPAIYPDNLVVGSWYYHLVKTGQVSHVLGIDNFDHYVKRTIAWANKVHHSDTVTDEDGNVITTDILNRDYFNVAIENKTHVLIKVKDDKFDEITKLITYATLTIYGGEVVDFPTNTICSDKFKEAISDGGEFYVVDIEDNNI